MFSTLTLFAIGIVFLVVANFFLNLWISNKQEERMLSNLISYLEKEETRKKVKG